MTDFVGIFVLTGFVVFTCYQILGAIWTVFKNPEPVKPKPEPKPEPKEEPYNPVLIHELEYSRYKQQLREAAKKEHEKKVKEFKNRQIKWDDLTSTHRIIVCTRIEPKKLIIGEEEHIVTHSIFDGYIDIHGYYVAQSDVIFERKI